MNHNTLQSIFGYNRGKNFNDSKERYYVAKIVIRHDMMPRTLKGVGKLRKVNPNFDVALIGEVAEKIYDFLCGPCPNTQADFDLWHENMCIWFENSYNKILKSNDVCDSTKKPTYLKYGKAQKVINMTIKNFVAMDNAAAYMNHLQFCHMPLDSKILEWFSERIPNFYYVAWSNMDRNEYKAIQQSVKGYVANNSSRIKQDFTNKYPRINISSCPLPLSLFDAEVLIWA